MELVRPVAQRHTISLEINPATREWIEEQLDGLEQTFIIGKASRSAGEVLKGALSHPIGFAALATPIIAVFVKILVDKNKKDREENSMVPDLKSQYERWERSFVRLMFSAFPDGEKGADVIVDTGHAIRDALFKVGRLFTQQDPAQ